MADFERDYIMRMVRDMTRFITTLVWGRTDLMVTLPDENKAETADLPRYVILYADAVKMADDGDVNGAENLFFSRMDVTDTGYLEAGLAFFHHLSEFGDERLEQYGYSPEEIVDGIRDLADAFGIDGIQDFE